MKERLEAVVIEQMVLPSVPAYDDVVDRNDIKTLQVGGDLVIKNGDIAVSRRGDLLLNNDDYHAYFRAVQKWRFTYPIIRVLFDSFLKTYERTKSLEKSLENCAYTSTTQSPHPLFSMDYNAFHALNDEISANELARGVFAGSIMMLLSNLLLTFRSDIGANESEWNTAGKRRAECSIGQIIAASANNVRHADEWAITNPPTETQLKSVRVLSSILNEPIPPDGRIYIFSREISPDTLLLISGGDFSQLEYDMFQFTNSLLDLRKRRKSSS